MNKFVKNARDTSVANSAKMNVRRIIMQTKCTANVLLVMQSAVVAADQELANVSNVEIGKYTRASQTPILPHSIAPQIAPLNSRTGFIHTNSNRIAVLFPHMSSRQQTKTQKLHCF